ncbi:hypothetical protein ES705_18120 [subsurface metagenome]
MTTKRVPLVETLPYAAGATRTLGLERVGLITHLDLLLRLNATFTDSIREDGMARIIKGLAIRDGQGHTWDAYGDGRQLYWKNYLQYQGQVRMETPATGVNAYALFQIHFGPNPLNPFDPISGIPAVELGQLALEVTWGAITVLGSGVSALTGEITVTPAVVLAGPQYNAVRPALLLPNNRWEKVDIGAVIGEIGLRRELPAGAILRKTDIMVTDGAAAEADVRSDDDVSEVGYIKALENVVAFRESWETLLGRAQAKYGLPSLPSGITRIDWGEVAGDVALDLRGRLPGLDLLGFTTKTATGDIWIAHSAYSAS